jgi:hypothetical protein
MQLERSQFGHVAEEGVGRSYLKSGTEGRGFSGPWVFAVVVAVTFVAPVFRPAAVEVGLCESGAPTE